MTRGLEGTEVVAVVSAVVTELEESLLDRRMEEEDGNDFFVDESGRCFLRRSLSCEMICSKEACTSFMDGRSLGVSAQAHSSRLDTPFGQASSTGGRIHRSVTILRCCALQTPLKGFSNAIISHITSEKLYTSVIWL
mmetsp:Transcript_11098/g.18844  ORF Transcript_11098/g.18844 Transcript_11098/m.18844 type:complete len:137 (-) Transcript_11098:1-411(-)